jgi:excinuclease ABC subunit B
VYFMFKLRAPFSPSGDQPKAIKELVEGLNKGYKMQTLLGVTGSGKSFSISNVIAAYGKPTLVMAHNKTLAFQLYNELKSFFPENKVEFFISYYDYYQPESYLPASDTYIEKDAKINPKIEQMRLSATTSLLSRKDVIIVASVSAIYSIGDPEPYKNMTFTLEKGMQITRKKLLQQLIKMQYVRNDTALEPGNFRVKGSTIDLIPTYQDNVIRILLDGDTVQDIIELKMPEVEIASKYDIFVVFPAKHFVIEEQKMERALEDIKAELEEHLPALETENSVFAYRLQQKVNYDMEMIKEMGYCNGIENYSRFFDGRQPGDRPYCLLDFFPKDFLLILDESHQTIPQINGMYKGDRSRKQTLVDYGFRLPSTLDNRPQTFEEFKQFMNHVICMSATPAEYEREHSSQIVEQIIRPTGLVDPEIEVRKSQGQMQDLIVEINNTTKKGYRTLVTTITKRMAEDLTDYFANKGLKVRYLHSEIDSLERTEIIRQLRLGEFDVLVGINLLREGLDIPEVGLVGILDADKEGFLRNDKSLIQTIGRAARNAEAKVILYADNITDAIEKTVRETKRRRNIQLAYNKEHNITPKTIIKPVAGQVVNLRNEKVLPKKEIPNLIIQLDAQMKEPAENLDFEQAIQLRNKVNKLREKLKK